MGPSALDLALGGHIRKMLEDADVSKDLGALVFAACTGPDALDNALARGAPAPAREASEAAGRREVWLASLTVEGIRGIRGPVTLSLDPEPGVVLIAGRNGAGKSSLAEGLEALLFGKAERWRSDQGASFGGGWQNVHHGDIVRRVSAIFRVEGRAAPLMVERRWTDSDPDKSELLVDGVRADDVDAWGGRPLVTAWCPLLACGLAARTLEDERPSGAFDALASVLGLDSLQVASNLLRGRAKVRKERVDASDGARKSLREALSQHPDPRAAGCATLLEGKGEPDLDALRAILSEGGEDQALGDLNRLRRMSNITIPDDADAANCAAAIRTAIGNLRENAGPAAQEGEHLATLLDAALHIHGTGAEDCPVCGTRGVLDATWVEATQERAQRAKTSIRLLADARRELGVAETRTGVFLELVVRGVEGGLLQPEEAAALIAWRSGASHRGEALAQHVETAWMPVRSALEMARQRAATQLDQIQRAWLPLAREVQSWVDGRASALLDREDGKRLREAEAWLKQAEDQLRQARFAPIRDRVLQIWHELRQESSVDLLDVAMIGARTRRKLVLTADVDGVEVPALRVASQGELNALTLSVFVPRAALDESPFRFVVVDDPIQAMDGYKIDGLARVLGALGRTRQTLILTHDDRLLESLRCQQVPITVVGIHRKRKSEVAASRRRDPIQQHLADADRIVSAGELDPEVAKTLVFGFCREAVEAALLRRIRRQSFAAGLDSTHDDLEESLTDRPLRSLAAMALVGDPRSGGKELEQVLFQLTRRGDLVQLLDVLNKGAHGAALPEVRAGKVLEQARALTDLVASHDAGHPPRSTS